jgi:hypothetical protein
MNKKYVFLAFLALSLTAVAQNQSAAYLEYINAWKDVAVQQQVDYGIPASITMAQALLESGAGSSELAQKAKNHFGIKCTSDWLGASFHYDDERRNECFRKYGDAAESYKDHSLFLKRTRYITCFEIAVEDYEGWAYRLRECGYATDPLYASKLIKLIEDYHLDSLTLAGKSVPRQQAPKRPLKATVVHKTEPIMVINNDPEPPLIKPLTAKEERDSFLLIHTKKRCNGIPYVIAREGDTYPNVAFRLNMRERDLREYNDALGREMQAGDRIFMAAKKNVGANEYVWTYTGQSLWELSQEEGVYIEAIQKYNALDPNIRTFRTRQKIFLKKVKDPNAR